jgi:hypothetical protein
MAMADCRPDKNGGSSRLLKKTAGEPAAFINSARYEFAI